MEGSKQVNVLEKLRQHAGGGLACQQVKPCSPWPSGESNMTENLQTNGKCIYLQKVIEYYSL